MKKLVSIALLFVSINTTFAQNIYILNSSATFSTTTTDGSFERKYKNTEVDEYITDCVEEVELQHKGDVTNTELKEMIDECHQNINL